MTDDVQAAGLSDGAIQIYAPYEEAGIALHTADGDEMLRVTKNGFYVRGVRVPADDQEARAVYVAFKQWLTWANLQRS